MDALRRNHLNEFKELFSTSDNLRYLELWNFKDPMRDISGEGYIDRDNLAAWLRIQEQHEKSGEALEGLRIMWIGQQINTTKEVINIYPGFSEGPAKSCYDSPEKLMSYPPLRMRENTFLLIS